MKLLLIAPIAMLAMASATGQATAGTDVRYQTAQGGVVCKGTDPTLNTALKAKATGFRNEGTSGAFIVCGMESSNSRSDTGTIQVMRLGLYSLNNIATPVNCTAVNGYIASNPLYKTRTVTTKTDGTAVLVQFDASDFGGTAGEPLANNDYWSITCSLPAKTSVGFMATQFTVNTPGN
jgi:hypothetical protein